MATPAPDDRRGLSAKRRNIVGLDAAADAAEGN